MTAGANLRRRLEALERDLNTEPLILTMPDGRIVIVPNGADYLAPLLGIAIRSETASPEEPAQLELVRTCTRCREPGGSLLAELACAVLYDPAEAST